MVDLYARPADAQLCGNMQKPSGPRVPTLPSVIAVFFALTLSLTAARAHAQVKPGDMITARNAEQVRSLVSPGTFIAVSRGMQMNIVAPSRVDWPPPFRIATEKYSGQVRLSRTIATLVGYVAGQPFPLLDPERPRRRDQDHVEPVLQADRERRLRLALFRMPGCAVQIRAANRSWMLLDRAGASGRVQ